MIARTVEISGRNRFIRLVFVQCMFNVVLCNHTSIRARIGNLIHILNILYIISRLNKYLTSKFLFVVLLTWYRI